MTPSHDPWGLPCSCSYLLDIQMLESSSRHSDSRDSLILPSIMISLAIVATGTLDLGHGIIISRSDVGLTKVFFLEYRLRFKSLKFGVEVRQTLGATVGMTSSIGERVVRILHFLARSTPVPMQALAG